MKIRQYDRRGNVLATMEVLQVNIIPCQDGFRIEYLKIDENGNIQGYNLKAQGETQIKDN